MSVRRWVGHPLPGCWRRCCCSKTAGRAEVACLSQTGVRGTALGMNGFSTEEDSRDGPPAQAAPFFGQTCCLIDGGERCPRPAGNASFSKRVQKSISQKKLKLDIDKNVRHLYICDFHKNYIQSVRNKRKRKTSDDGGDSPEHETDIPEVDLFQLQVNTLRRYKRYYKLQTRPGLNKAQLAEVLFNSERTLINVVHETKFLINKIIKGVVHLSNTFIS
ncbi:hypothetical protein XELAEV_18020006mg [Xenopus laevis]|uniref:Uncharacterized protein n=2 Tax=Xenopus laevis TaxID=8355 RepID=A0A974HQL9_XENLA|nr:hypothetical protein XELAEV_18020006mg [Xenopus laevis]